MLKTATAEEMRQIDAVTIEKYGLPGIVLMERAALAVVNIIEKRFFKHAAPGRRNNSKRNIIILCGGGNNGGDGFAAARLLRERGRSVRVYMTSLPRKLKGDAKTNYEAARKYGVPVYTVRRFFEDCAGFSNSDCLIVDALLGTGLSSEVKKPLPALIEKVNGMSAPVVSVDMPSGVSSDTGQVMGCAVRAGCTVTFGLPKRGQLLYPGAEYAGELFVEDIGFPRKLTESGKIRVHLVQPSDAKSLIPPRPEYSHKGTYGHVLVVAGSKGKTGAALMAAKACLRAGAGLVTIGVPGSLVNAFQARVTEEMILPLPDKGNGTLALRAADDITSFLGAKAGVLAAGPGMSVDEEISELVARLITASSVPMVIDADGINAVSGRTEILRKSRAPVVLTPHPGEMAGLMKKRRGERSAEYMKEIQTDRIGAAMTFAKRTNTCLVLKGAPTVTAAPGGDVYVNSTGNPGMATAGTGDVLTGMIAAFLAQGLGPREASVLGVYMHGCIGDAAAVRRGKHSLIASDILRGIPGAFKHMADLSCK